MPYDVPSFLKRSNNALLFDQDGEFIFYVPEANFGSASAVIVGSYVRLLGTIDYAILSSAGKMVGNIKRFYHPTVFLSKPYKIEKAKDLRLNDAMKPTDFRLLRYKKEDEVISSIYTPNMIDNVEELFRLFVVVGKIPTTIPYNMLQDYFVDNMLLNGSSYGVSDQLLGLIYSELCRDPEDVSKPFRLSKAIDKDMCSYEPVSIKVVPKYTSPYVSLTSENFDEAVMNAVLLSDKPDGHKNSPLEKIMTM